MKFLWPQKSPDPSIAFVWDFPNSFVNVKDILKTLSTIEHSSNSYCCVSSPTPSAWVLSTTTSPSFLQNRWRSATLCSASSSPSRWCSSCRPTASSGTSVTASTSSTDSLSYSGNPDECELNAILLWRTLTGLFFLDIVSDLWKVFLIQIFLKFMN